VVVAVLKDSKNEALKKDFREKIFATTGDLIAFDFPKKPEPEVDRENLAADLK